jgi:hypothetical protein
LPRTYIHLSLKKNFSGDTNHRTMRFAYSIKQKMKIAILLFCIMACTILIRILEDKSVKNMNESFVSMYNDRLIPATDLYYMAEHIHAKSFLLEDALYADVFNGDSIGRQLDRHNAILDSLIQKYEKTFLVKQEKQGLNSLKNSILKSSEIEKSILQMVKQHSVAAGKALYHSRGRAIFRESTQKLTELIGIQTQVGQELIQDSEFMVSGSKIYSTMQVALAILIGILIVGIVFTSNVVNIRNDKFKLN